MFERGLVRLYEHILPLMSEATHARRGLNNALSTFNEARKRVPAYRDFLEQHGIESQSISSLEAFRELPQVDKHGYLHKYEVDQLCLDGTLDDKYLIEGSSGYSNQRSYWPRLTSEDRMLPYRLEALLRNYFQIHEKPTLAIVGLMLGVWVSGEKTSWSLRQLGINRNYPLSLITPGANAEEIIDIIKKFSPLYEQTIIIAYPPFVKYLTDLGDADGMAWEKFNIKLITGGECFSEDWRAYMRRKLGQSPDELAGIIGVYGASEMSAMMGQETRFSIMVKQAAVQNPDIATELFGQSHTLPTLCQYNPAAYFIEKSEDDLLFTSLSAMPLVRYNIHDRGGVLSFEQLCSVLKKNGCDIDALLARHGIPKKRLIRFPFLYVYGRSDGSALIYGAVIYPENIKAILDKPRLARFTTGLFVLVPDRDEEQNERLRLLIELSTGVEPDDELLRQCAEIIMPALEVENTDYRALRKVMGEDASLEIELCTYQSPPFDMDASIKHHYIDKKK